MWDMSIFPNLELTPLKNLIMSQIIIFLFFLFQHNSAVVDVPGTVRGVAADGPVFEMGDEEGVGGLRLERQEGDPLHVGRRTQGTRKASVSCVFVEVCIYYIFVYMLVDVYVGLCVRARLCVRVCVCVQPHTHVWEKEGRGIKLSCLVDHTVEACSFTSPGSLCWLSVPKKTDHHATEKS